MKRLLYVVLIAAAAWHFQGSPVSAQTGCEGTSGSATIDGAPWSTLCVIAATSPDCIDSLGANYECFQIVGTGETETIAIFLAQTPVQGQTYPLGGASENGAMLFRETGFWMTTDDPYTGQVQVTSYQPGSGTLECTFSFRAQSLFFGPDVNITNGVFLGRLEAVGSRSWSDVKNLYRETSR